MARPKLAGAHWVASLVALTCSLQTARATNFVTFTFEAEITGDSDLAGTSLPINIGVGDVVSGYLTYDLDRIDTFLASPSLGVYSHSMSPASLYAEVEGAVFQTDAGDVSVDVFVSNGGNDSYYLQSDNNVANMGIGDPDFFDFQLLDSSGMALASDAQPASPLNVADFDAYSMNGTRLAIEAVGDYMIFAEITSITYNHIVDDDGFATAFSCDAPGAVCFASIQDAIDALGAGETITVCPGVYAEDIVFPIGFDGMTLTPKDPDPANTVIQGVANVNAGDFPLAVPNIEILADDIDIGGFTIRGPAPVAGRYSSGLVIGGDNADIHDNAFEVTNAASLGDISQGIQTYRDGNNPTGGNVDGLIIRNNTFTHLGAGGAGYEAIYVNHVNSDPTPAGTVSIRNNVIAGKLIRGITSERSRTEILVNDISTDLAPLDGSLDPGESLQAVNIVDANGRDQQEVSIRRNTIGNDAPGGTLILTGVIDGPLSMGLPKAVELYVQGDIADLSEFGLGAANNGGGSDGIEFTFPAGAASDGTFIYVTTDATGFTDFFGFAPDHVTGSATNINGDDAIELFRNGDVIDVFGEINVAGSGQPWEYTDGWAYRNAMTGPDGSTFVLGNWSFSGVAALGGETSNASAATPMPIGTYAGAAGGFAQGVRLGNDGAPAQTLTSIFVEENTINGNAGGVLVRSSAGGVTIFNNDLSGNDLYGVDNIDAAIADAGGNWWGDFDALIVGGSVGMSGNVDYTPWLAVGTDTGAAAGFQGDFSTLYVDDDSPQANLVGRIQEGIDLVTASTVHVLDGEYEEQVTVYKSVELLGANAGVNPNTAVRGPESIVYVDVSGPDPYAAPYPSQFYVTADNVVIDGFTVDGDNPYISSGIDLNGADLDAEEGIVSYEGVGDITIRNNIVRNTSYTGINFYNYTNGGAATSNNIISNNRIENLGAFDWGIGILIYNDFYADITDNVITDVRVGVQTGNYDNANPGATGSISDNDISARLRGIFYNLHRTNASPFAVNNNSITGVDDPDLPVDRIWFGMLISSQSDPADADFMNNTIDGSAVTSITSAGIVSWNNPTGAELTIDGGSVTGVNYGVWVNNFEGYSSDGNDTSLYIEGLSVNASDVGIYVYDSPDNTNGSSVFAHVSNNTDVMGASVAGVLVYGADASAVLVNNLASITGNSVGVEVDGGTALLESNNLSGNSLYGLLVQNGGLVDAGDADDNNVTGLGSGSGATHGSSIGCNFLAGYDGSSSFAIVDENLDAMGHPDVLAEMNFWGTQVLSEIEDIVDHDADDPAQTLVFYDDPKSVPELIIAAPEMCQNNNPSQIVVTLSMDNLPIAVTGYFAVIEYDPGVLELDTGTYDYSGGGEFPIHLNGTLEDVDPMNPQGLILADASAAPMTAGTAMGQQLATLTFNIIGCGDTTIGFGPPPTPSIMSQVSFQGIGLTTQLIEDSVLIDTGNAPMPDGQIEVASGMLNSTCETVVTLSATIVDDCCMDLAGGASVVGSVGVTAGDATLGTPSFNYTQGDGPNEVIVTASVPVTLNDGCSANIEFSLNAVDCCGNPMMTVTASTLVEDLTAPTFVSTPADVIIECDASIEPGILLGQTDASSGIGVYYNDNGMGENGDTNVAYLRVQAAYANTNAAPFDFSSAALTGNGLNWAFLFGQVSPTQHGFDMILPAPTWDLVTPIPGLSAWENTTNAIAGSMNVRPVTWAFNDYKGGSPNGPANPATSPIHSTFRSATDNPLMDVQDTYLTVSQAGTVYTANFGGKLVSDDTIYWYTQGTPDTSMSAFSLDGEFYFTGELSYDSSGDSGTDLIDFYQGSITVTANSPNLDLGYPLANDNCSPFPEISYTDVVTPGACAGERTITRTWTATDICGNQASHVQTITVIDMTPPVIEQPAPIEVPADAGSACNAVVSVPPIVATDNCSGPMNLIISNDYNNSSDASDTYPEGTTTITWTVEDDCGNIETITQDITVLSFSLVEVVVELSDLEHDNGTPLSFERSLRFILNDGIGCSSDICEANVLFAGAANDTPAASVTIMVPCDDWTSICVKDDQLTLYDTVTLTDSGAVFTGDANVQLLSGDTDNDGDVDINDVTFLLFAYGASGPVPDACPYDGNRSADFSIDGAVGSQDYSIMQANWLKFTGCSCPAPLVSGNVDDLRDTAAPFALIDRDQPVHFASRAIGKRVVRIDASEVSAVVADVVDRNRDGVIDDKDVRIFENELGLPNTLSQKIGNSVQNGDDLRDTVSDVLPDKATMKRP